MPLISTVILNWNRIHLLKITIESYLSTISVPYELVIVDNNSSDGSKEYIQQICNNNLNCKAILLTQNLGGEAINLGLERAKSPYLHISENDVEYLPGWDKELLDKFDAFQKLGQLSVIGSDSEMRPGEIRGKHQCSPITENGKTILLTEGNVSTTSMIRREIWDKGARWSSVTKPNTDFKFPADGEFSILVKQLGYLVAWNDKYVVIDHGNDINEWQQHLDYYVTNYRSKPWLTEEGMKKRLIENGYDLVNENGKYRIIKMDDTNRKKAL